ncbi:uncharacterized protein LOC110914537 [Helianthus annuus]|uniref:uncharacterized protein LOC110914537 n=1 Tax=Helianthus annuus TaxID=4232 RepID=UPI000B900227|nr:uncharacterized protein LOC110914537 [Helianthus annuus]
MMNAEGFFFFKFDSKEGMHKVLEGGPWIIRKVPLFLNIWSPSVSLKKEGIKSVPIWVKFHNVPISIYTDDGLSLLASKIGCPKRLDSYTADMCVESWGRSSFARALIEISADEDLRDHIVVAIPNLDDDGFIMEKVTVEYEWKPHRCATCCIFGHNDQHCPKKVNVTPKQVVVDEEGFISDKRKVAKFGMGNKKQKQKFIYRPKITKSGASTSGTKKDNNSGSGPIKTANAFEALANADNKEDERVSENKNEPFDKSKRISKGDSEMLEVTPTEMADFMANETHQNSSEGASTPGMHGLNG